MNTDCTLLKHLMAVCHLKFARHTYYSKYLSIWWTVLGDNSENIATLRATCLTRTIASKTIYCERKIDSILGLTSSPSFYEYMHEGTAIMLFSHSELSIIIPRPV